MADLSVLEKASAARFLITLLENDGSLPNTKLLNRSNIHRSTFYDRKPELAEAGFITIEEKVAKKNDTTISPRIWISLTSKGQKVARKLKEIEGIMEEKE